jgi:hypothetical protein
MAITGQLGKMGKIFSKGLKIMMIGDFSIKN